MRPWKMEPFRAIGLRTLDPFHWHAPTKKSHKNAFDGVRRWEKIGQFVSAVTRCKTFSHSCTLEEILIYILEVKSVA